MFTWTCQKCTRKNWAHLNYCGACGELQPALPQSRPQPISSIPVSTLAQSTSFERGLNLIFLILTLSPAMAHDAKRPDLDTWYSQLQATGHGTLPSGASCCSKADCHTTEAEMRNGEWWARLGTPISGSQDDWELGPWVKIPNEIIVRGPNGNPVRNEAGEAVICHSRTMIGNKIVPQSPVFCFVPGNET